VQSDVLCVEKIQAVLSDLETKEPWHCLLFLLWLSTWMRNAEIRGLAWDCIRWEEGEVLACKSLWRDRYSSGEVEWAPIKTGKDRCGLKLRRLYSQRHGILSHASAMGNSPADLVAAVGHSTKMLMDTYAKPTGRLKMPTWQAA